MSRKLLIVGLLAVAFAVLSAVAWRVLFAPPKTSSVILALPDAPWPDDMTIKDSWTNVVDPPDRITSDDLHDFSNGVGKGIRGNVLYNPPLVMMIEETERIEVRIAPLDFTGLLRGGLIGKGPVTVEELDLTAVMRVRLRGSAFTVDPPSGEAQAIQPKRMVQWSFDVTPVKSGKQTLDLEISYLVKAEGNSYPMTIPPFRREIEINVGTWKAVLGVLKERRELVISTTLAIAVGLGGFFLKLWYMERRTRKLKAMEAAQAAQAAQAAAQRPRKKRRR